MSFAPVYGSMFERLLACSVEVDFGHKRGDCWLWCGCVSHRGTGYGRLSTRRNGKNATFNAHRVMAELVVGHKLEEDRQTIEHDCAITACVNPWHFKLATRSENTRYRFMRQADKDVPELPWLLDFATWGQPPMLGRELPVRRADIPPMNDPPF